MGGFLPLHFLAIVGSLSWLVEQVLLYRGSGEQIAVSSLGVLRSLGGGLLVSAVRDLVPDGLELGHALERVLHVAHQVLGLVAHLEDARLGQLDQGGHEVGRVLRHHARHAGIVTHDGSQVGEGILEILVHLLAQGQDVGAFATALGAGELVRQGKQDADGRIQANCLDGIAGHARAHPLVMTVQHIAIRGHQDRAVGVATHHHPALGLLG